MTTEQQSFLEQLYMQDQEKLYTYALSILHDPETAMDVVQDTFHTAAKQIQKLTQHENPDGWLMITLKHKILEALYEVINSIYSEV